MKCLIISEVVEELPLTVVPLWKKMLLDQSLRTASTRYNANGLIPLSPATNASLPSHRRFLLQPRFSSNISFSTDPSAVGVVCGIWKTGG